MPPFPERESSILAKLKKKKGVIAPGDGATDDAVIARTHVSKVSVQNTLGESSDDLPHNLMSPDTPVTTTAPASVDLLGIGASQPINSTTTSEAAVAGGGGGFLVDVFGEQPATAPTSSATGFDDLAPGSEESFTK
ncbi:AP-2 complex subunit alpha-2-like [Saccoglossus kowalevskii]